MKKSEIQPCKCGCEEYFIEEKGPHLGIFCTDCARWLGWLTREVKNWRTYKMPFGKYKGMKMEKIPLDYLDWIIASIDDEKIVEIAQKAIETFAPKLNEKLIWKLVSPNGDILFEGLIRELLSESEKLWEDARMIHSGFIHSKGEVVATVSLKSLKESLTTCSSLK